MAPHRSNRKGDLGNYRPKSAAADIDNIFFTEEGWVYRHFKGDPNDPKTRFWDEIIVAGQVDLDDGENKTVAPTIHATPERRYLGLGNQAQQNSVDGYESDSIGYGTDEIVWEQVVDPDSNSRIIGFTDGCKDVQYAYDSNCYDAPPPPGATLLLGTVELRDLDEITETLVGDVRQYIAEMSGGNVERDTISGVLSVENGQEGVDYELIGKDSVKYLVSGSYTLKVVVQTTEDVVDENPTSDTLFVNVGNTTLGSATIEPTSSIIDEGDSVTFTCTHEGYDVAENTITKKLIVEGGTDYTISGDTVTFNLGTSGVSQSFTVKYEISSSEPSVLTSPIYTNEASVSVSKINNTTMKPVSVEPESPPSDGVYNVGDKFKFNYVVGGDADQSLITAVLSADNGATVNAATNEVTFNNAGETTVTYTLTSTEELCEPKVETPTFKVDAIPQGSTDKPWEDEDGVVIVHFFTPDDTAEFKSYGTVFKTFYQLDGSGNFVKQLTQDDINKPIPNGEYIITLDPAVDGLFDSNGAEIRLRDMTDMSEATTVRQVFSEITEPELKGNWNLAKATDLQSMMAYAQNITDLSNLSTPVVENVYGIFMDASFKSTCEIPDTFDTSKVYNAGRFFRECKGYSFPLKLDLTSVQSVSEMFFKSDYNLSLSGVTFGGSISNVSSMFRNSKFNSDGLEYLDLSNVRQVSDANGIFGFSDFNQDISNWCNPNLDNDVFKKDSNLEDENLPCSKACPVGNYYGGNIKECTAPWFPEFVDLETGPGYEWSDTDQLLHLVITTDKYGTGAIFSNDFKNSFYGTVYEIDPDGSNPRDVTSDFSYHSYGFPQGEQGGTTKHYLFKGGEYRSMFKYQTHSCELEIGKFTRLANGNYADVSEMFMNYNNSNGIKVGGKWDFGGQAESMFQNCNASIQIGNDWVYSGWTMNSMFRNATSASTLDLSGWCISGSADTANFGITGAKAPDFDCYR